VNTDVFEQAPNNQVDILWVIDDSNSMSEEQAILREGFGLFAAQLEASGTDFHIGVISTSFDYDDPERGVLKGEPAFLTSADDYVTLFTERATVGVEGSDKEKGLEAAVFALQPAMTVDGGPNEGFVRPDAALLVVVVSDEEDCSDHGVLEGRPADSCYRDRELLPPVGEFIRSLEILKDDRDQVQLAAIIGTELSTCAQAVPGTRYATVAALTGGLIGDICAASWDGILTDLGLNAVGIRTTFQLTDAAQPETLEVWVTPPTGPEQSVPEDPVSGWTYDPATWFLTFHGPPPERGSQITVKYTVQPGAADPQLEPATAAESGT
jgi:hypothetical protein